MIDETILAALFDLGDRTLQGELQAHLVADFARLSDSLLQSPPARLAAVAHELKGLAATVGATRLAEMAETVCLMLEARGEALVEPLIAPLRAEIALVIAILDSRGQSLAQ